MTRHKHFKRRVRERMQRTGESYTTARLRLLETARATPQREQRARGELPPVRFRRQRLSQSNRRPLGIRHFAPSFGIVIFLAIGVAGFLTVTTSDSQATSFFGFTEEQP